MKKKTILIVDDDPRICLTVEKFLSAKQKYKTLVANDGESALQLAKRKKPHLIILDVVMPNMNGLEVLRHLKEDPKTSEIPVIMLTGQTDEQTIEEAMYGYATHYLTKPVSMKDLHEKVEAVLEIEDRLKR